MKPGLKPRRPTAERAAAERDADLVAALRRGDRHAVLEGLMDRYRQKVMNLAFSILRDPALAEDMSQTVFVKVWQAMPSFDGRAALSTWLYTIARNTCLTAVTRERRMVPLEDFNEASDDDDDPLSFGVPAAERRSGTGGRGIRCRASARAVAGTLSPRRRPFLSGRQKL